VVESEILMAESEDRLADMSQRANAKVDKFANRRLELADAALTTLAELGLARTSLRDIAKGADFSHGMLRHYFNDKNDLILQCIRQYKSACVRRYDLVTELAVTQADFVDAFVGKLKETLLLETKLHRLWYELRSQALFDEVLREDVQQIDQDLENMIWRIVERYAHLGGSRPKVTPAAFYAVVDGLFQSALARVISGDTQGAIDLEDELRKLLPIVA